MANSRVDDFPVSNQINPMDTTVLLIGSIVVFILVVMFIVAYGGPSAPVPVPALQVAPPTNPCDCPDQRKHRDNCPRRRHRSGCGCDRCRGGNGSRRRWHRRESRHRDRDGPFYEHGGRDRDDGLLDGMDGFTGTESTPAPTEGGYMSNADAQKGKAPVMPQAPTMPQPPTTVTIGVPA
jgi:hypothetical protein